MRYFLLALTFAALSIPFASHGAEFNAGLVQGLWYSDEPIFAGETVRIYVALRNNTEHDLTGVVRFTDNEHAIGSHDVSALPDRLVEAWVDWKPREGEHTLRATLTEVKLHPIGGGTETGEAASALALHTLYIDVDTDSDNIGNEDDPDDDNDTISDDEETENGTDPLVFTETVAEDEESMSQVTNITEDNAISSASDASVAVSSHEHSPSGLERYIDEGSVDTVLTSFTARVNSTKTSLDAYRESRSARNASAEVVLDTGDATSSFQTLKRPEDMATITRTKIEDSGGGLMASLIGSIQTVLSSIYTLVLFIFSKVLAHPAIVQLLLLLVILIAVYKLARKLGRRPQ